MGGGRAREAGSKVVNTQPAESATRRHTIFGLIGYLLRYEMSKNTFTGFPDGRDLSLYFLYTSGQHEN